LNKTYDSINDRVDFDTKDFKTKRNDSFTMEICKNNDDCNKDSKMDIKPAQSIPY